MGSGGKAGLRGGPVFLSYAIGSSLGSEAKKTPVEVVRFERILKEFIRENRGMKKRPLDSKGIGFIELVVWVGVAAVLGWLGWQLYQHPESLNTKSATHSPLEDTRPSN